MSLALVRKNSHTRLHLATLFMAQRRWLWLSEFDSISHSRSFLLLSYSCHWVYVVAVQA